MAPPVWFFSHFQFNIKENDAIQLSTLNVVKLVVILLGSGVGIKLEILLLNFTLVYPAEQMMRSFLPARNNTPPRALNWTSPFVSLITYTAPVAALGDILIFSL